MADITPPSSTDPPSMLSPPPHMLVVNSSPALSLFKISPQLLLAAIPAASNLAKNLWPSFSCPKPAPPTSSLPCSVSLPPPTSPPSNHTPPLAPSSPTIALPHTSVSQVNSHHAQEQEQEEFSKIGQYNTDPTKKPPQA